MGRYDWYTDIDTSVSYPNSTEADVTVSVYWHNNGWDYNISSVSAQAYCSDVGWVTVATNVKVNNDASGSTNHQARTLLGSKTYRVSRGKGRSVTCQGWIDSNGSYAPGEKYSSSESVSITAKPSYTVSYNANGGTGAPGNQTKWYGESLTLSSSKPARTGYTFQGWNTNSSGTGTNYSSGDSYTANAAVTLYAKWKANTYTVSFDANGGTGAPGNQTKTYGVTLKLSTTVPTRTNYEFLGWGTAASSITVSYAAGANYTNNSPITLYAIWKLKYVKPSIGGLRINRCDADGNFSETGTYYRIVFNWSCDQTIGENTVKSVVISCTDADDYTAVGDTTAKNGLVDSILGNGDVDIERSYTIGVTVTDDTGGSTLQTVILPASSFAVDVLPGGRGVAIGKPASKNNYFDIGPLVNIDKQIQKEGESAEWIEGRDKAAIRITSVTGNSPILSQKTTNGSWDVSAYDDEEYEDQLIFSFADDSNYESGTNTTYRCLLLPNTGRDVVVTRSVKTDGNAVYTKYSDGRCEIEIKGLVSIYSSGYFTLGLPSNFEMLKPINNPKSPVTIIQQLYALDGSYDVDLVLTPQGWKEGYTSINVYVRSGGVAVTSGKLYINAIIKGWWK